MIQRTVEQVRAALADYGLQDAGLELVTMGNINLTYRVRAADGDWSLQRLNPIFPAEVQLDIRAVTERLAATGMDTPLLRPTRDGRLWSTDADGGVWRVMSWKAGVIHQTVPSAAIGHSAGALLGRFHAAVADLHHTFHSRRLGVHDTARHLDNLRQALHDETAHPAYDQVQPVGREILALSAALPAQATLPERLVHGDPKLNNIVFNPDGEARCLIDLDTLAYMPIPVELGDALRSWCNPAGEEDAAAHFELPLFEAALEGYAAGAGVLLGAAEVNAIVPALQNITLELAARFCADALQERYFNWDRQRYATSWQHHLLRARSQLALARSIAAQTDVARRVVAGALGVVQS